jgi:4-diphosphocytidyl-2C-methyl-D-erythritol kinase
LPARQILGRLVNDLEAPAFTISRELAGLRGELERRIGRVVRMSGSGSSLFTLFDWDEEREAEEAAGMGRGLGAAASVVDVTPAAPR